MACCLMALSHYPTQCWLLINMQFYWIYNGYFDLKFKHVTINESHISFKGFIDNKPWRLFQMSWLFWKQIVLCQVIGYAHLWSTLPNAPHPGLRVSHAPFSRRWQPGKRKWTFVNLSNAIPLHSSQPVPVEKHGFALMIRCLYSIFEHRSC